MESEIDLNKIAGDVGYLNTEDYQIKLILEIVNKYIPNITLSHIRYRELTNENDNNSQSILLTLDGKNSKMGNSEYFSGKGTKMVHFTKYETLIKILRNPKLRLYNLHHLNDPREFEFANRIFQT